MDLKVTCDTPPKIKFPDPKAASTMAKVSDKIYTLREELKKKKAIVLASKGVQELAKIESKIKQLEEFAIENINLKETTGAIGKVSKLTIKQNEKYNAEDWDKIYAYIKKNNAFYIMNKGLKASSLKELYDQKKKVPGVGTFILKSVSVTKS